MVSTIVDEMRKDGSRMSTGLVIASVVIATWTSSLCFLLSLDLTQIPLGWLLLAIAWQTFLSVGLFITAHDAMHGSIYPQNRRINDLIGAIAIGIYGLFSYRWMRQKHRQHHQHPASSFDPDFHDGQHPHFLAWYWHFMKGYATWQQQFGMTVLFHSLRLALHIPVSNLILVWIVPLLLSSLQLFYFGTFLPHKEPRQGYTDSHKAESLNYSLLWSFLSCYHFGYHWEHHEYPLLPWWKLPTVRHRKPLSTD